MTPPFYEETPKSVNEPPKMEGWVEAGCYFETWSLSGKRTFRHKDTKTQSRTKTYIARWRFIQTRLDPRE